VIIETIHIACTLKGGGTWTSEKQVELYFNHGARQLSHVPPPPLYHKPPHQGAKLMLFLCYS